MDVRGRLKRLVGRLGVWLAPVWKTIAPVVLPLWNMVRLTVESLGDKNADLMAAGLGFYALISIAPLLVIAVAIGGAIVGQALAHAEIHAHLAQQLGEKMADFVVSLAESSQQSGVGALATTMSIVALLLASSRLFGTLSAAINSLWGIPDRGKSNVRMVIWRYVRSKLLSVAGVLAVGVLFLGLIAVRFGLTFAAKLSEDLRVLELVSFWTHAETFIAMAILTVLFALIFRFLPDRKLPWKPLWIGGAITALLMLVGRGLISRYLGTATIESAYGAAGSVVVFLFWAYYSSLAFLFGAKLTHVLASGDYKVTPATPHPK